ncbi:MAG: C25 family cysteine peptidase [archaeon]
MLSLCSASAFADQIVQEYSFSYTLSADGQYDHIELSGGQPESIPGNPLIPYYAARILLPEAQDVSGITIIPAGQVCPDGTFNLKPGQEPYPFSFNGTVNITPPNTSVYSSSDPYPGILYKKLSTGNLKGYRIAVIRLYPVQYTPDTGQLCIWRRLIVALETEPRPLPDIVPKRGLIKDLDTLRAQVDNPSDAVDQYQIFQAAVPSAIAQPSQSYEYVVITGSTLNSTFAKLVSWKNSMGLNATSVLVEDIAADPDYHCDGEFGDGCGDAEFNDTQAHIRNFIKDAYASWGTSYVLLGGDDEIVPVRGTYQQCGSYTDNSLPSDLYYGCLDGSWNSDLDDLFGESDDGNGDDVDLQAEVYVGRATVETAAEADNFINKTIEYYNSENSSYIRNALLIGEELDEITWGGNSKDIVGEMIRRYNITRIYNRDSTYSESIAASYLNRGTHIANHNGHANWNTLMSMSGSEIDELANDRFFFYYTIGCITAAFDTEKSGSTESVAEHMIFNPTGAFAFIGNTRYGWYWPGSAYGPSAYFDNEFFDAVMNKGIDRLGPALDESRKERLSAVGSTGSARWIYFELTLLGDPHTKLFTGIAPPVAYIESPDGGTTLQGIVSISGYATPGNSSAAVDSYALDAAHGTNPSSWSTSGISLNGTSPVAKDHLGQWDTSYQPDGRTTLRLMVTDDNGQTNEDRAVIIIDNSRISAPSDNEFFRAGNNISIYGTVNGTLFEAYAFHWGTGSNPSGWSDAGISVAGDGSSRIGNSLLATWNTENITSAGYYALRLTVNSTGFSYSENITIVLDPDFQVGWPQKVNYRLVAGSVAVGDIDNDGYMEVGAGESLYGGSSAYFYLWHYNGSNMTNWPQYGGNQYIRSSPVFVDIDGDNDKEIFVGTGSDVLRGWHHTGYAIDGYPLSDPRDELFSSVVTADIGCNGDYEFLVRGLDGFYAWHQNGSLVAGWPKPGDRYGAAPSVADLTGDGCPEIIDQYNDYIYAYHANGSNVSGWPVPVDSAWTTPAVGDLNDDGSYEVVVMTTYHLFILHPNGSNVTGWPIRYGYAGGSPALGDLDGDNSLEIVFTASGRVWAVHLNGSNVTGWPMSVSSMSGAGPVIGDIDGDSDPEILLPTDYYSDRFYAWHHNGSNVSGWPKITPKPALTGTHAVKRSAPLLKDIDSDGDIEVILGDESYLLVWDLPAPYNAYNIPWGQFKHDDLYTGLYSEPAMPPLISGIQCRNASAWAECGSIAYNHTITAVRANCSDPYVNNITNGTITLENLDDSHVFFRNSSIASVGYQVVNNSDIIVADSGTWRVTVSCTDDEGLSVTDTVSWDIPWGSLTASLVYPAEPLVVQPNQLFNFTAEVGCIGGECGNVTATLDPSVGAAAVNASSRISVTMTGATGTGGTSDHTGYIWRTSSTSLLKYHFNGTLADTGTMPAGFNDIAYQDGYIWGIASSSPCLQKMHLNGSLISSYATESGQGIAYDPYSNILWVRPSATLLKSYYLNGSATGQALSLGLNSAYGIDYYNGLFCTGSNGATDVDIWNESGIKLADTSESGIDDDTGCAFIDRNGRHYIFAMEGDAVSRYEYSCEGCPSGPQPSAKGTVPMNSGTPFYTLDTNPLRPANLSCLASMGAGDSCNQTWRVNATGSPAAYEFYVVYLSSYGLSNETPHVNITINSTNITFSLSLASGWSLISVPIEAADMSPASFFSSLDNLGRVWMYNASDSLNPWRLYDPGGLPLLNTLTEIRPEYGYWISVASAETLTVTGDRVNSLSTGLEAGWNLMGYPFAPPRSAMAAISGISGFGRIWAYNSSSGSPWKLYDPGGLPMLNTLSNLDPGSGYWVRVDGSETWALS